MTHIQVDDVTEKYEYTDDYQGKTLCISGPTEVCEDIITEMCQSMFGHRMNRITDLYTTVVEDTKEFLGTDNDVMILMGPGTEIWEPSTLSLVDENILVPTYESFSERHANVAGRLGKNIDRIECKWGQAIKPEDIREALESSDKQYDVVATVISGSSTDVRNPIEEIGSVVAEYPDTYLVVDAMLTLSDDYVDTDGHNIDVIFTSSQKAFAMPPGLAICAVSDETYEHELSKDSASWYGGFQHALDYYDHKGQTHSTPATPIMLAYRKQMKRILEEGHEGCDRRHREMAEYTHEQAYERFDMFPEKDYESQTITYIENTQGIDVTATIEEVNKKYDITFSNGYGSALGEKTFRISCMGEHDVESTEALTGAIEDVVDL